MRRKKLLPLWHPAFAGAGCDLVGVRFSDTAAGRPDVATHAPASYDPRMRQRGIIFVELYIAVLVLGVVGVVALSKMKQIRTERTVHACALLVDAHAASLAVGTAAELPSCPAADAPLVVTSGGGEWRACCPDPALHSETSLCRDVGGAEIAPAHPEPSRRRTRIWNGLGYGTGGLLALIVLASMILGGGRRGF